jgi:dCMP deaminase
MPSYNGTARGLKNCNEGGCARCNGCGSSDQSLDECLCLHAEENALLEAGNRIADESTLYCNTLVRSFCVIVVSDLCISCPCLKCSVKIVQAGVKEVVYHLGYKVLVCISRPFELD